LSREAFDTSFGTALTFGLVKDLGLGFLGGAFIFFATFVAFFAFFARLMCISLCHELKVNPVEGYVNVYFTAMRTEPP
jgi:hypothetical protein